MSEDGKVRWDARRRFIAAFAFVLVVCVMGLLFYGMTRFRHIESPQQPPAAPALPSDSTPVEPEVVEPEPISLDWGDLDLHDIGGVKETDIDVADRLPRRIRDLDGRVVSLCGVMRPDYLEHGLKRFRLVPAGTPFGPMPPFDRMVMVRLAARTTTSYTEQRRIVIVGTFRIQPEI